MLSPVERAQHASDRFSGKSVIGLVDWLSSCPENGWFEPIPSESTDTL